MRNGALQFHDAELNRMFSGPAIVRGRSYAKQRRILDHSWTEDGTTLAGACLGSRGEQYRQHVRFRGEPTIAGIAHAVCTCPVAANCKHVVALLFTVRVATSEPSATPTPMASVVAPVSTTIATDSALIPLSWRTTIAAILDTPTTATTRTKPLALAVGRAAPTRYSRNPSLTLRPMIQGKRDKWIRTGASWREIAMPDHPAADPTHHAGLRAIHRMVVGSVYSANHDYISLAAPPAALWRLLAEAIADGVALIADPNLLSTTVRLGSADVRYTITAHRDGAHLGTEVVLDDHPVDAADLNFIGAPDAHGLWTVGDGVLTLAPLQHPIRRDELTALRHDAAIVIPTADLPEFSVEALPRLTQQRTVQVDEGLLEPPSIDGPEAVLTLKDSERGARYYWSVGYRVNDVPVVFDPSEPTGTTPYREAGIENQLWSELLPQMRTIARHTATWRRDASLNLLAEFRRHPGSRDHFDAHERLLAAAANDEAIDGAPFLALRQPATFSIPELAIVSGELLPQLRTHPGIRIDYQCTDEFHPVTDLPEIAFTSGESERNDWFGLEITVTVGDVQVPIADLISALSAGEKHMILPSNAYFSLDTPELQKLADLLAEARTLGEIDSGRVSRHSLNATFWEELLALGVVDKQLTQWRKHMAQLAKAAPPRPVKPSRRLKAELRDYQHHGLNWLTFLWKNGLGGILADDMGLGKTVQTLALVARAADADRTARFLVVAPTSVVPNWVAECGKFVPGLRVSAITATEARTGIPFAEQVEDANIVVTSYTLLRLLFDDFDAYAWDGAVFDEAQFIKNHTGKTHQCARRLDAPFKLAITGTPMENNLMELWSLLSVTAPGLFPSPTAFADYFRKPIESGSAPERLDTLRRRIKPVMLRRTKDQVAIDLPAKQEQAMVLDLSTKHRKIYDTRLARERQKVLGLLGDWEKNRFQVFRSLSMLRQLSLHAALVDTTHNAVNSAKVDYLSDQLPALIDEGHSALVFSQFTGFLDIIRARLDEAGIVYSYLDGSMTTRQRDTAVRRFTSGATQVFLISLKAGGFGLNLTEADYCFVCDPWWNPAAEAQAVDRAHRIGQQRPVNVYRLVSADTIEERVVRLQDRKRALFDAVVDDGELFGTALSADDIREMLA